jgi:hypothetical protein
MMMTTTSGKTYPNLKSKQHLVFMGLLVNKKILDNDELCHKKVLLSRGRTGMHVLIKMKQGWPR